MTCPQTVHRGHEPLGKLIPVRLLSFGMVCPSRQLVTNAVKQFEMLPSMAWVANGVSEKKLPYIRSTFINEVSY